MLTSEQIEILKNEVIRGKLLTLPMKIRFMNERGYETIDQVHAWMSETRKLFEKLVEEIA